MKFLVLQDPWAVMPFTLRCLEIVGLRVTRCDYIRFLVGVFWSVAVVVFHKVYFGFRDQIDLQIRGYSELFFEWHQIGRILLFSWKSNEFDKIVQIVEKVISNVRSISNKKLHDMVIQTNQQIDRRTKIYTIYTTVAVNLFVLVPLLQTTGVYYMNRHRNETERMEFVTAMELEFLGLNFRENVIHYIIFEIFVVPVHYWTAAIFVLAGIIMYSAISCSSLIFSLVSERLSKLHELSGQALRDELSDIIKMHVDGLKSIEHLERIVTLAMLLQVIDCVLIWISMVLYIKNNLSLNAFSVLVLLIVTTAETYALCVLTTQLTYASYAVADTVYNNSSWSTLPVDVQKDLAMMLQRAQKREGVTAAKFCFMDIERFGGIARASYSMFVVLKDML
ncbi:uncharacterized protein LOC131686230 [Topomyia yanbarensis]|uniref:uncharacterized protein LOC131686230 n=1 Tax=Topomyia yanbarensis TaxID=2498891 RepID=UPI00273B6D52|nr:uncharacterized protein LOC131686230 [Topomyia yanbarensis]